MELQGDLSFSGRGNKSLSSQEQWKIFKFISDYKDQFPIEKMCSVLQISRSGFYAWLKREPSKRSRENKELVKQIKMIYNQSKHTYGSPRITEELNRRNYQVSRPKVARLMKRERIFSTVKKKYVVTTNSKHNYPIVPNLLQRNFTTNTSGTKWVSDITYIKVKSKWLYLKTVIDLFDRKVIGWALSITMSTNTCLKNGSK
jgi:transposase InsO family protein